jgi:adenosylmethionine-8-amino-7-oxononanoate aminotransferase
LPKSLFLGEIPQGFDLPPSPEILQNFEQQIKDHQNELAAFIIEPVVQGAGGMRIYNPEWLVHIRRWCDEYNILLIADEIATGFGRTGQLFGCNHANITPDIMCLGKAICGGYMTLAATLATDDVAEYVCASDAGVFMHGPTFMGNPLACSVANASLTLLNKTDWQTKVRNIEASLQAQLSPVAELESVDSIRVLGAIGVMEMKEPVNVAKTQEILISKGVWVRPFGKLIYIMPPYIMSEADLGTVVSAMKAFAEYVDR